MLRIPPTTVAARFADPRHAMQVELETMRPLTAADALSILRRSFPTESLADRTAACESFFRQRWH